MDRPAFTPTRLQEERDLDNSKVFSVRLNLDELKLLEDDARFLEQEKMSTALKQLAFIGHEVIHDPKTRRIIETVLINRRRNKRTGIAVVDPDYTRM